MADSRSRWAVSSMTGRGSAPGGRSGTSTHERQPPNLGESGKRCGAGSLNIRTMAALTPGLPSWWKRFSISARDQM